MINFSNHALLRMRQRNISVEDICYVIRYGKKFHKGGALIFFLRFHDIPDWDQKDNIYAHLSGTAVILTKDGRIVTTIWRNQQNGLKRIKHKKTYKLSDSQLT